MSLRTFHLLFILTVMLGADLFAVWAVWTWTRTADRGILALGILAVLGGLGLLAYAVRLVRALDPSATR
jgi:hypothetical protein